MKTLILDTSSDFLYLFLTNGVENYEVILEGKNNHSEKIIPLIEEGLNKLNMEVASIERIICGVGPGSYTGLRVSVTVCKMFSYLKDIPIYTISSLDILGSGAYLNDGTYAICNPAKKDYLYSKVVKVDSGKLEVIEDDKFVNKEEFINGLSKDIKIIDQTSFKFDCNMIISLAKNKVEDVHALIPNYLREALS